MRRRRQRVRRASVAERERAADRRMVIAAGLGDSTLGTPGLHSRAHRSGRSACLCRSASVARRVIGVREGDAAPAALNRGFGVSLGWEIAPRLSLRAWSLRDVDALDATTPLYAGGPLESVVESKRFDRDLVCSPGTRRSASICAARRCARRQRARPLAERYALTSVPTAAPTEPARSPPASSRADRLPASC